jgi:hypothetical protein
MRDKLDERLRGLLKTRKDFASRKEQQEQQDADTHR